MLAYYIRLLLTAQPQSGLVFFKSSQIGQFFIFIFLQNKQSNKIIQWLQEIFKWLYIQRECWQPEISKIFYSTHAMFATESKRTRKNMVSWSNRMRHLWIQQRSSGVKSAMSVAQSFQRHRLTCIEADEKKNISNLPRVWTSAPTAVFDLARVIDSQMGGDRAGLRTSGAWIDPRTNNDGGGDGGIPSFPTSESFPAFFFRADQLRSLTDARRGGRRTSETIWQFSFLPQQRRRIPPNVHNHI